mmetsp:Transcript_37661/g.83864  ORF Transcript_37661/g.83864 Transcript_37661/m.83864 type:complete len:552 (-) Transcript_37661:473-2128(-)|eukprot:CAMPEP_0202915648 /NCGR_PEP_ID=MMETSP1392-20130828/66249_1 /ASSEMBLY_ACC=CAM_ASM_000868 /TAXON_ID=225041 /ORGANISM="Chlamydomonas chlamydogama, Strain SAG 11-48b" /LENGTH=551 /DNA_ID=CAMNT_0049607767 /DNA_START=35 /DNA_END=1690 /DNA_ORIENTATION=+
MLNLRLSLKRTSPLSNRCPPSARCNVLQAVRELQRPRAADVLDLLAATAVELEVDDAEYQEKEPVVCPQALEEIYKLLSSCKSSPNTRRLSCTNCTAPMMGASAVCSICGHDHANDPALLGTSGPWKTRMSLPAWDPRKSASTPSTSFNRPPAQGPPGTVALAVDERMLQHRASLPPYPERPERVRAIMARLDNAGLTQRCYAVPPRQASDAELAEVHSRDLINSLAAACSPAGPSAAPDLSAVLEPGAAVSPGTNTAARLAAGAAIDVALAVARRQTDSGVAVVRPPGHHATFDRAQAGCYFNNVALAARAVQAAGAAQRVLIVDWDVHFGNGTHEIFSEDNSVLYVSMHRSDGELYPNDSSGDVEQCGTGEGAGHSVNISWAEGGITDGDCMTALNQVIMPLAYNFSPDLILVSAGFGAAEGDVQGGCRVSPACYGHMTHLLKAVAPVALVLEGGVNLDATARCMEACVRVLLGERPPPLTGGWNTSAAGTVAVMNTLQIHGPHWPSLRPLSFQGWMDAINEQKQAQAKEAEADEQLSPLELDAWEQLK